MSRPLVEVDVFRAIADPQRRRILEHLAEGEQRVRTLNEKIDLTQPALSQHLRVLREVGLVEQRTHGRERIYRLNPKPLAEVAEWIGFYERFWESRLDKLGRLLAKKLESPNRKSK